MWMGRACSRAEVDAAARQILRPGGPLAAAEHGGGSGAASGGGRQAGEEEDEKDTETEEETEEEREEEEEVALQAAPRPHSAPPLPARRSNATWPGPARRI